MVLTFIEAFYKNIKKRLKTIINKKFEPMKIMKKLKYLFAVYLLLAAGSGLFAYKFDFVTVGDVVKEIRSAYGKLDSYQASFTIESERHGKRMLQKGIIRFKNSDRIVMDFYQPSNQKIVSNGKTMWIYIPSMNVVAEQDLNSGAGLFSSGSKSGLNSLFSKYHYRFASKEQPETMKDGSKKYTLELKQKESRSGYREINLQVDENYFITMAQGVTSTGKKVSIVLTDIKKNIDLPESIFKFDVPARAGILKNPMMSEE